MPLFDLDCRHAKPTDKAYRIFDTRGLYLEVKPTGTKIWRLKFKYYGKEKLLTIGKYPNVSLLDARNKQQQAKTQIENGIDPSRLKQDEKKHARFKQLQTFELVACEWHKLNCNSWSVNYADEALRRLKRNVFPYFGKKAIHEIGVSDVLVCLQKMEERNVYDLAHRILRVIGQILRYAVITGRIERDFTADLRGALKKYKKGHFAAIELDNLPDLLQAINRNEARLYRQTILAIRLILLTFVRTSELINARWEEFDLENAMWKIPAERMKMRRPHLVPLSKQVIGILNELGNTFSREGYVLPGITHNKKPMSNNTILKALGRLGYEKIMTGHGFRALAMSAIKEKLGYRHEIVDRQLSHVPRSMVDQAYDRATFIPERVKMMQDWADYIDSLSDAKFVAFEVKHGITIAA